MPRSWKTPKRRKSRQQPDRGQVWQDVLEGDLVVIHGIRYRPMFKNDSHSVYIQDVVFIQDDALCYQPLTAFVRDYRFTGGVVEAPACKMTNIIPGPYVHLS